MQQGPLSGCDTEREHAQHSPEPRGSGVRRTARERCEASSFGRAGPLCMAPNACSPAAHGHRCKREHWLCLTAWLLAAAGLTTDGAVLQRETVVRACPVFLLHCCTTRGCFRGRQVGRTQAEQESLHQQLQLLASRPTRIPVSKSSDRISKTHPFILRAIGGERLSVQDRLSNSLVPLAKHCPSKAARAALCSDGCGGVVKQLLTNRRSRKPSRREKRSPGFPLLQGQRFSGTAGR